MDLELIEAKLKAIESIQSDSERAHILEDSLFVDFITYVSKEAGEPFKSLAVFVLKVRDIEFDRWCA
jgi:hypothetical protein